MWTSASAITDADDCLRRWWFNKRCKLPQDQSKPTVFGDVLHAVCERYLRADDRGIDPATGKSVELYPTGWEAMKDRWSGNDTLYKISNEEAALVKALIHKAIVEGVLVREPGRIIEKQIESEVYSVGYAKVIIKGFIDLCTHRGIEDHKTTSNPKYLLSKAKIKKSIQMIVYAYAQYLAGHKGNIWLCHNGFVKNFENPAVRKTDVECTEIEVKEFFVDKILPLVKKMFRYYKDYPKTLLHKWRDVPPANNPNQSCNFHYGKPCPYITICSGVSTIDQYLRKYGKSVEDITGTIEIVQKGVPKMHSLITSIKKEQEKHAATRGSVPLAVTEEQVAPAAPAVEVKEATTPTKGAGVLGGILAKLTGGAKKPEIAESISASETTEATISSTLSEEVIQPATTIMSTAKIETVDKPTVTTDGRQVAPWYTLDEEGKPCIACKENTVLGYNSKMEPCQICYTRAKAKDLPTYKDFEVTVLEGGTLQFTPLTGGASVVTKVAEEPIVKTKIEPVEEKSVEQLNTPLLDALYSIAKIETKPPNNTGIDLKLVESDVLSIKDVGFDLLIGCIYVSTIKPSSVVTADTILQAMLYYVEKVAEKPVSSIAHFELMQAIDALIPAMIKDLSGTTVISVMPSKGSAHARLIDGLRLHAKIIIQPLVS